MAGRRSRLVSDSAGPRPGHRSQCGFTRNKVQEMDVGRARPFPADRTAPPCRHYPHLIQGRQETRFGLSNGGIKGGAAIKYRGKLKPLEDRVRGLGTRTAQLDAKIAAAEQAELTWLKQLASALEGQGGTPHGTRQ